MKRRGTRIPTSVINKNFSLKSKRSQITIFVIIAVLIIAVAVLIFVFREQTFGDGPINVNIVPVNDIVIDCLEKIGNNAIIRVGENGGYSEIYNDINYAEDVPYYVIDEKSLIPSMERVESEISLIIEEELPSCVSDFGEIFDEYEGINHELRDAKTSILDDAVVLELNYPIVKDFSFRVRSRVDDYYEISQKTIVEQQKHAGSICISCLFDLSEEYDVKIEMRDSGNSTIITIVDEEYKLSEESYEWRFAIK